MKHSSIFSTITHYGWLFFISGLLTILPLVITVALFRFLLRLVKHWFEPLQITLADTRIGAIPHIEIITVIVAIFVIGMLMQTVILHSIVHALEKIIFQIPLVRPVYSGIKRLVHAFNPHDTLSFKKVVLVQFPRVGTYSIGFITSQFPEQMNIDTKKLFNVFIPHTPNPTSGFLVMVPQDDITVIDLTRQEAMALIISGGIITPDRFNK